MKTFTGNEPSPSIAYSNSVLVKLQGYTTGLKTTLLKSVRLHQFRGQSSVPFFTFSVQNYSVIWYSQVFRESTDQEISKQRWPPCRRFESLVSNICMRETRSPLTHSGRSCLTQIHLHNKPRKFWQLIGTSVDAN